MEVEQIKVSNKVTKVPNFVTFLRLTIDDQIPCSQCLQNVRNQIFMATELIYKIPSFVC